MEEAEKVAGIILAGDWTQFIAMSIVVCVAIVGVYFFSRIRKSAELKEVNLNFEKVLNQQARLVKQTENIRHTLEKESILFQVKTSFYRERSITAIDTVYKKLLLVKNNAKEIALSTNVEVCKKFSESVVEFRYTFDASRIWLPLELAQKIENLAIEVDNRCHKHIIASKRLETPSYRSPKQVSKLCDIQDEFYDYIHEEMHVIFDQLIGGVSREYNPNA